MSPSSAREICETEWARERDVIVSVSLIAVLIPLWRISPPRTRLLRNSHSLKSCETCRMPPVVSVSVSVRPDADKPTV